MPSIVPISDLKNYSEVLRSCDQGATVYLTKNGRGKYVVQSLAEYEKLQATVSLLAELSKGIESYHKEGGLTVDEAFDGLEVWHGPCDRLQRSAERPRFHPGLHPRRAL